MNDPDKTPVQIQQNPNDPICMRASIGGFAGKGFYCQIRYGPEGGKPEDLIAMLERVLFALRKSVESAHGPDPKAVDAMLQREHQGRSIQ